MIKRLVHIEPIVFAGEKRQFQIKLPLNTRRLIALDTWASLPTIGGDGRPILPSEVGWLWLQISGERDVFYADDILFPKPRYGETSPKLRSFEDFSRGGLGVAGTRHKPLKIGAALDPGLIEGYYEDRTLSSSAYEGKS